mmetsp:Transcript_152025/g.276448  ORF Transcript_152025/g.276448 Transcript_152025/m.276448 type:complete len:433 (+) Transcript_152025:733-2031(+)
MSKTFTTRPLPPTATLLPSEVNATALNGPPVSTFAMHLAGRGSRFLGTSHKQVFPFVSTVATIAIFRPPGCQRRFVIGSQSFMTFSRFTGASIAAASELTGECAIGPPRRASILACSAAAFSSCSRSSADLSDPPLNRGRFRHFTCDPESVSKIRRPPSKNPPASCEPSGENRSVKQPALFFPKARICGRASDKFVTRTLSSMRVEPVGAVLKLQRSHSSRKIVAGDTGLQLALEPDRLPAPARLPRRLPAPSAPRLLSLTIAPRLPSLDMAPRLDSLTRAPWLPLRMTAEPATAKDFELRRTLLLLIASRFRASASATSFGFAMPSTANKSGPSRAFASFSLASRAFCSSASKAVSSCTHFGCSLIYCVTFLARVQNCPKSRTSRWPVSSSVNTFFKWRLGASDPAPKMWWKPVETSSNFSRPVLSRSKRS